MCNVTVIEVEHLARVLKHSNGMYTLCDWFTQCAPPQAGRFASMLVVVMAVAVVAMPSSKVQDMAPASDDNGYTPELVLEPGK